jgi:hypothetical protein
MCKVQVGKEAARRSAPVPGRSNIRPHVRPEMLFCRLRFRTCCARGRAPSSFSSPFSLLPPVKSTFQRPRSGPTQSSPVKPSQTESNHPSPPGKQIGKETVKFLATFDHRAERARLRAQQHPTARARPNVLLPAPIQGLLRPRTGALRWYIQDVRRRFGLNSSRLCIKNAILGLFGLEPFLSLTL